MKIQDIMTANPDSCSPDTRCRDVAKKMKEDDVGAIPVCDDNGKCIGIVTDRDIVCKVCACDEDINEKDITCCMSTSVETCYEDDDLSVAEKKMSEKQVRRLPVLNHEDKLVGMVSLADIARNAPREKAGDVLCCISEA